MADKIEFVVFWVPEQCSMVVGSKCSTLKMEAEKRWYPITTPQCNDSENHENYFT